MNLVYLENKYNLNEGTAYSDDISSGKFYIIWVIGRHSIRCSLSMALRDKVNYVGAKVFANIIDEGLICRVPRKLKKKLIGSK